MEIEYRPIEIAHRNDLGEEDCRCWLDVGGRWHVSDPDKLVELKAAALESMKKWANGQLDNKLPIDVATYWILFGTIQELQDEATSWQELYRLEVSELEYHNE